MPDGQPPYLWQENEDVRMAELVHCLGVLDGDGPESPSRAQLAVVVDWALRERYGAEMMQRKLRRARKFIALALRAASTGQGKRKKPPKEPL